ncbi:YihY family inner membrane protein [Luteimonas sp. YGD11-2]|uniref:YihY family inner membrane protein n=1 Tax=Luteimonas sp. YGD11-2 TaxID=2508168 RepID=UPI00100C2C77|nr:YihY family inner membrane protein [Luteimonas sp. YGD11-2]
MEPLDTLTRWSERLTDRARSGSFLRFLWRRFVDDRLFEAAGALAFTTVFALVPLSMVVFGVLSAFPVFESWSAQLTDYIFSNFVPDSARQVEQYLLGFSRNIGQLTALGTIALVVSVLVTLQGVEATLNRIWRVRTTRPKFARFLVYWTVLTLGALVAAASLALFTRFLALDIFHSTLSGQWLQRALLQLAPLVIELLAIAAVFRVIPHRTVQWRHAFAGALLSALLLELAKRAIALYLGSFDGYERIYGQVSFIPVLLLWIYFCWLAILLGASFAASLSAFRYQPAAMRLPLGYEIFALLRLLGRFVEARRHGRGLHTDELMVLEPCLTDALAQQFFAQLEAAGILARAESGAWLLARDLDDVTLVDLYEACHLRIPVHEAHLPCHDDALGRAAQAALDDLRVPLRDLLKRRVGDIHPSGKELAP